MQLEYFLIGGVYALQAAFCIIMIWFSKVLPTEGKRTLKIVLALIMLFFTGNMANGFTPNVTAHVIQFLFNNAGAAFTIALFVVAFRSSVKVAFPEQSSKLTKYINQGLGVFLLAVLVITIVTLAINNTKPMRLSFYMFGGLMVGLLLGQALCGIMIHKDIRKIEKVVLEIDASGIGDDTSGDASSPLGKTGAPKRAPDARAMLVLQTKVLKATLKVYCLKWMIFFVLILTLSPIYHLTQTAASDRSDALVEELYVEGSGKSGSYELALFCVIFMTCVIATVFWDSFRAPTEVWCECGARMRTRVKAHTIPAPIMRNFKVVDKDPSKGLMVAQEWELSSNNKRSKPNKSSARDKSKSSANKSHLSSTEKSLEISALSRGEGFVLGQCRVEISMTRLPENSMTRLPEKRFPAAGVFSMLPSR